MRTLILSAVTVLVFLTIAAGLPLQRNFFTVNTAPVVQTTAGSNCYVTFTQAGQTRTYRVDVPTNGAAGASFGVDVGTNIFAGTNGTVVTLYVPSQTNGFTSIVYTNPTAYAMVTNPLFVVDTGALYITNYSAPGGLWLNADSASASIIPFNALHVVSVQGDLIATSFSGIGSNITSLTASNLIPGQTLPPLNAIRLTNLNASALASGTVPLSTLPAAVVTNNTTSGVAFTGYPTQTNSAVTYGAAQTNSAGLQTAGFRATGVATLVSGFSSQAAGSMANGILFGWVSGPQLIGVTDGELGLLKSGNGNVGFTRLLLGAWKTQGANNATNWPALNVDGSTNSVAIGITDGTGTNYVKLNAGAITSTSTVTATNGIVQLIKPSFTTNFTCTTNLQFYCCNGTNQLITLPFASNVVGRIFRFSSTNGYSLVTITNAGDGATIRDGTSLSITSIGIAPVDLISDGANWWLSSKQKTILPNAQFSCSTNLSLASANVAYPVTYNSTDWNNSQGISLVVGTNASGYASKIRIANQGQYEFTPSLMYQSGGATHTFRMWFRQNDTNIVNSCTAQKVSAGDITVITVPFIVNVTKQTDFELWVESDSTAGGADTVLAQAASGNYPASPSIIMPVKRISDSWP